MKFQKYFITLLLSLCSLSLFSQVLYTKSDTIPLTQDSVVLKVGDYRGNVQWQRSYDGKNWSDLEGKTTNSTFVVKNEEATYRAEITDGNCSPLYSDTAIVSIPTDTVSSNIIITANSSLQFISDSTELSEGIYRYTGDTVSINKLNVGKIIIDEESGGTIRKVIEIVEKGDTINLLTEQASIEDIFYDTSFKLSTKFIQPSQNLKSASSTEISKLLTDDDGYIHPVSVTFSSEVGAQVKSISIFDGNNNLEDNKLYWHLDLSTVFWNFQGEAMLPNRDGNIVTVSGNSKGYLSDSYITIDPEFKFEYEFTKPKFSWDEMKLSRGEITKFKFYSDESIFDVKLVFARESDVAFTVGKKFSLLPKPLTVTFKYLVGGIPLWIDYEMDLIAKISASLALGSTSYNGFQNKTYVTLGVAYENKDWSLINDIYNEYTPISYGSTHGTSELRVDLYPSSTWKVYSIAGPFFETGPYLKYESVKSIEENRNDQIALGVDAKVGILAGFMNYDFFSCSFTKNLFEKTIWESPQKIELVSGNDQTANVGEQLPQPIKVKVLTSNGDPVKDIHVYFRPLQGTVSENNVLTDEEGIAESYWSMSNSSGIHRMEVYVKNGSDEEMSNMKLDIKATADAAMVITTPSVTTNAPTNITETTATLNGNVTSDGGATITQRGFYWSSTDNTPDSNDNPTTVSGTTGSFSKSLTGLTPNTTYYYVAFATNSQGTKTGAVQSFKTDEETSANSGTFTDSRDGNSYKWVKIGGQTWMAENLAYLPNVSPSSEGSIDESYYYVYDYDGTIISEGKATANYDTYGVLYNWNSSLTACPIGWHLPSDDEWEQLALFISEQFGPYSKSGDDWPLVGKHIKAMNGWIETRNFGTDDYGFSGIPGGCRYNTGLYHWIGYDGYWWSTTATEGIYETALCRFLSSDNTWYSRENTYKVSGLSVRCIKD